MARKLAEVTTRPEGSMETLPSGLVTLPSATPHSVTSTLGSKDLGSAGGVGQGGAGPLVAVACWQVGAAGGTPAAMGSQLGG